MRDRSGSVMSSFLENGCPNSLYSMIKKKNKKKNKTKKKQNKKKQKILACFLVYPPQSIAIPVEKF